MNEHAMPWDMDQPQTVHTAALSTSTTLSHTKLSMTFDGQESVRFLIRGRPTPFPGLRLPCRAASSRLPYTRRARLTPPWPSCKPLPTLATGCVHPTCTVGALRSERGNSASRPDRSSAIRQKTRRRQFGQNYDAKNFCNR